MPEITYNLRATITLFPTDQGGRKRSVHTGYRPNFAFNTEQYYCGEIELLDRDELRPGETSKAFIKMLPARTIRKNLKEKDAFSINEGNKTVGIGIITEVKLVNL